MSFVRGDTCYILENNMRVRAAKVISKRSNYYVIQLVGSCGAIRLPEKRLFSKEEDALKALEMIRSPESSQEDLYKGRPDPLAGHRNNKNPHEWDI